VIHYLKGDATSPQTKGPKIIAHICNDKGRWGKGFVLALSKRWSEPEAEYRRWYASKQAVFMLGMIQLVQVRPDTWVANMIAQSGTKTGSQGPPIRYDALGKALRFLAVDVEERQATVHMPRIGTGLAGGRWELVEPLIQAALGDRSVFVYDYDK
jgi:O-acetyl-ADP-ribose deacetylase (regulator of RNase III)